MITIEIEHLILLAGLFFMAIFWLYEPFFNLGVIICISSYAVDLIKRVKEEKI